MKTANTKAEKPIVSQLSTYEMGYYFFLSQAGGFLRFLLCRVNNLSSQVA